MDDEDIEMVYPEAVTLQKKTKFPSAFDSQRLSGHHHMDALQEEEEGAVAAGGEGSDDQGGQEAEEAGTAGAKKVKNVVRRPQPKLNVDRLTSAKGLPVLIEMTKTTKFKGKGHELEDLDTILGVLDHWAHRTFPRFHSEFFYQRLESLGKKRQLQANMSRLHVEDLHGQYNGIDRNQMSPGDLRGPSMSPPKPTETVPAAPCAEPRGCWPASIHPGTGDDSLCLFASSRPEPVSPNLCPKEPLSAVNAVSP
ncbi:TIMELESS-interacting protein isoform X2 [Ixodes scapularis]